MRKTHIDQPDGKTFNSQSFSEGKPLRIIPEGNLPILKYSNKADIEKAFIIGITSMLDEFSILLTAQEERSHMEGVPMNTVEEPILAHPQYDKGRA